MRKLMAMNDSEFEAGSVHIAHVPVTNPTPQEWTYTAELYLWKDGTKYNVSEKTFTLSANSSDTKDFSITMPSAKGAYQVYLDIYVAGELIGAYQALEDVIVAISISEVWVDSYDWDANPDTFYPDELHSITPVVYHEISGPGVVPVPYVFKIALEDSAGNVVSSAETTVTLSGTGHAPITFPITTPSIENIYNVFFRAYIEGELVYEYSLGTVTVIPIPGPVFTYSNEQGGHIVKPANTNYSWLKYDCDITNPTGATATQIITLWHSDWQGTITEKSALLACNSGYGRCPDCKDPGQITLTLAPGQSYHYRFCGYNCSTMYASQDRLWLRDDKGGESAHKSC